MFSRRTTSTTVSRATSFSDSASLEMDRTNSSVQTLTLNNTGRRTMCLEEEDEDDKFGSPWDKLQETAGPMSSASEIRLDEQADLSQTAEVTILRITNLIKGCTTNQLYQAFGTSRDEMRIEVQGNDDALLHFQDADRAMKAYFAYLSSTSSLGTVYPDDSSTEQLSSSPLRHPGSMLRNRRSFQIGNGSNTMLSALSTISSWRSTDKLQTMNGTTNDKEYRLGHRSNSSRSSVHSKSTEKIPGLQRQPGSPTLIMSPIAHENSNEDKPLTMRPAPRVAPTQSIVPPEAKDHAQQTKAPVKKISTAKRILSSGFGFKTKESKDKSETQTKESSTNGKNKTVNGNKVKT